MKKVESQKRKPGELAFVISMLGFSLVAFFLSYDISGFESISAPGTLPILASTLLVVSALIICRQTWALSPPESGQSFLSVMTPRILLNFLSMGLLYVLSLNLAGFIPATFFYLFISMLYLHKQGWLLAFFVSSNSLAIIYIVFRLVFKVILPESELEL